MKQTGGDDGTAHFPDQPKRCTEKNSCHAHQKDPQIRETGIVLTEIDPHVIEHREMPYAPKDPAENDRTIRSHEDLQLVIE